MRKPAAIAAPPYIAVVFTIELPSLPPRTSRYRDDKSISRQHAGCQGITLFVARAYRIQCRVVRRPSISLTTPRTELTVGVSVIYRAYIHGKGLPAYDRHGRDRDPAGLSAGGADGRRYPLYLQ